MSCNDDKTQTFRMLEQPCALRATEKASDLRRSGRAYDFALSDSDYDAAGPGIGKDRGPSDPKPGRRKGPQAANR
ncbi:MAG: hypothetical protein RIB84_06600 [Sneathiellaceae bacterium]